MADQILHKFECAECGEEVTEQISKSQRELLVLFNWGIVCDSCVAIKYPEEVECQ